MNVCDYFVKIYWCNFNELKCKLYILLYMHKWVLFGNAMLDSLLFKNEQNVTSVIYILIVLMCITVKYSAFVIILNRSLDLVTIIIVLWNGTSQIVEQ